MRAALLAVLAAVACASGGSRQARGGDDPRAGSDSGSSGDSDGRADREGGANTRAGGRLHPVQGAAVKTTRLGPGDGTRGGPPAGVGAYSVQTYGAPSERQAGQLGALHSKAGALGRPPGHGVQTATLAHGRTHASGDSRQGSQGRDSDSEDSDSDNDSDDGDFAYREVDLSQRGPGAVVLGAVFASELRARLGDAVRAVSEPLIVRVRSDAAAWRDGVFGIVDALVQAAAGRVSVRAAFARGGPLNPVRADARALLALVYVGAWPHLPLGVACAALNRTPDVLAPGGANAALALYGGGRLAPVAEFAGALAGAAPALRAWNGKDDVVVVDDDAPAGHAGLGGATRSIVVSRGDPLGAVASAFAPRGDEQLRVYSTHPGEALPDGGLAILVVTEAAACGGCGRCSACMDAGFSPGASMDGLIESRSGSSIGGGESMHRSGSFPDVAQAERVSSGENTHEVTGSGERRRETVSAVLDLGVRQSVDDFLAGFMARLRGTPGDYEQRHPAAPHDEGQWLSYLPISALQALLDGGPAKDEVVVGYGWLLQYAPATRGRISVWSTALVYRAGMPPCVTSLPPFADEAPPERDMDAFLSPEQFRAAAERLGVPLARTRTLWPLPVGPASRWVLLVVEPARAAATGTTLPVAYLLDPLRASAGAPAWFLVRGAHAHDARLDAVSRRAGVVPVPGLEPAEAHPEVIAALRIALDVHGVDALAPFFASAATAHALPWAVPGSLAAVPPVGPAPKVSRPEDTGPAVMYYMRVLAAGIAPSERFYAHAYWRLPPAAAELRGRTSHLRAHRLRRTFLLEILAAVVWPLEAWRFFSDEDSRP